VRRRLIAYSARFAALGFGLLLAELLFRLAGVAYPAWDRPTKGLREWGVPHAEGWAVGETRMYVKLNAEGARDVDHGVAKPADAFRIVVVGDSYAAAFEVEMEEAFWSVMERELATCPALAGRAVEAINISKRGYGTVEELLALRHFGFKYDPDYVVLAFLTGNDFRNNSKALKSGDRPYLVRDGDTLVLDESYAESAKFKRWTGWQGDLWYGLLRHSRFLQVARHARRQIKSILDAGDSAEIVEGGQLGLDDAIYLETDDPAWTSAWQTTEDAIRLMRNDVRSSGSEFFLMTLSNGIQVNPDRTKRDAYEARIGADDLLRPDRRLEVFAAGEQIPSLMMAPALLRWAESNDTCVHGFREPWLCQGHWNAQGHRVAGEELARALCDRVSVSRERNDVDTNPEPDASRP
jgi:hypothetical protein